MRVKRLIPVLIKLEEGSYLIIRVFLLHSDSRQFRVFDYGPQVKTNDKVKYNTHLDLSLVEMYVVHNEGSIDFCWTTMDWAFYSMPSSKKRSVANSG